jgi:poly(A) polymerase
LNSPDAPNAAPLPAPRIIARSEHSVSRAGISPNALRVLYRLREGGFQGFLVGGCVRDLLLGLQPKDFDVATDALPEQVRKLFRNCRLIGRRFRLAHVFFGREIIEVATFRAASAPSQGEEPLPEADADEADAPEADALKIDLDDDADDDDAEVADLDDDDDDDDDADNEHDDVAAGAAPEGESLRPPSSAPTEPRPEAPPGRTEPRPDDVRFRQPDREPAAQPARAQAAPVRSADADDDDVDRVLDEHGRILRDNVYGTIDADVWRRDFTANALYYNISDFSIWDYCSGFEDIAARRLRLIGDPETRFREDPVRMLRAARFEAKLGFDIEPATAGALARLKGLLTNVPPARLFDETLKLFLTGHGASSLDVLRRRGLFAELLPATDAYLNANPNGLVEKLLVQGLKNTDARAQAGKPLTPTFLFALLLYGPIAREIEATPPERWHEIGTILDACERAVREAQRHMSIPRRFSLGIREMFALQPRLEHPRGRRALRVLEHPRFRASYDMLLLRADLRLASPEMADWWTRIQQVSAEERAQMADALNPRGGPPRVGGGGGGGGNAGNGARRGPRRRRRRRPSNPS